MLVAWLKKNHKWFYPIVGALFAAVLTVMDLREKVSVLEQAYIGSTQVMQVWAERVRLLEERSAD